MRATAQFIPYAKNYLTLPIYPQLPSLTSSGIQEWKYMLTTRTSSQVYSNGLETEWRRTGKRQNGTIRIKLFQFLENYSFNGM